jgi:hypothetical protein
VSSHATRHLARAKSTSPASAFNHDLRNVTIQLVIGSVTKVSDNVQTKLTTGDSYVQPGCCMSCGVPQSVAPDLVGWTNENLTQCFWLKQPQTAAELDRAIKIIHSQELGCHRYSGSDPAILQRLPAEDCDHFRPDLKLHGTPFLRSSGAEPKFTLSASIKQSAFIKLWRTMLRK